VALSLASSGSSVFNTNTSPKTAVISWATGDIIVVGVMSEGANNIPGIPTAVTGPTFASRGSEGSSLSTEATAEIFTATASSSGTSQTLSCTTSGGTGWWGFFYWIWTGTPAGQTGGTGDLLESNTNMTPASGDAVCMACADWNAVGTTFPPGAATGSGTSTLRISGAAGHSANYNFTAIDWQGCAAGTFGFGLSSYTGFQVAKALVVIQASASVASDFPGWSRRRNGLYSRIGR
jgi:hypothetical protein